MLAARRRSHFDSPAMRPGLIFDLDGTLVDSLPGIAASLNRSLSLLGLPVHGSPAVRGFIGNGSLELARKAVPAGSPDELARQVEAAFKEDYALTWPDGTAPYPGIPECLATLAAAGFPMAVLSNKPHPFTVEIVARLFPGLPFDPVLGQRPETPRKPDPWAALQIARCWGFPPENCRFIGDSTIDLATARAAGIPAVAVGWGYHDLSALQTAGARLLVENIPALPSVLGLA
jgi:phosphoglycolate phosphatase